MAKIILVKILIPDELEKYLIKEGSIAINGGSPDITTPGVSSENLAKSREITVGTSTGRAYPTNTDRPGFIAPPSEPLQASMQKQEQLKEEIRLLLNLAISNLRPQRASADSKKVDDRSLEAGLSYIGLTLETAERSIAHIWNQYENETEDVTIKYPKEYSLKTDQERRDEATELDTLRLKIPSPTYQKEVSKIIANILLSHKINRLTVEKIEQEIEDAPCVTGDPDSIRQDVEAGILDIELAYTFITKTPPAPILLLKAAGLEKGSGVPNRNNVGKVTKDQVVAIAKQKMPDLNAASLDAA